MPGPVSDSYDPEWGTSRAAGDIKNAIESVYKTVSSILGDRDPVDIRNLAYEESKRSSQITARLSEWQWRIIRFSLERAEESI